jgi:alanine dehydrogenase
MDVVIVTQSEIGTLLPMDECIEVMDSTMRALAEGRAIMPLRQITALPEGVGLLGVMPSYLGTIDAAGVKVITVFPGNEGTELDAHQGAVLLFEARRGRLLAVMDATAITAIRTAAVSGVATRALAREDAGDLAILGSGTQARTHLEAMRRVRPIRRVRVWSREPDHARRFADRESARQGVAVEVSATAREAVEGADLICTTTSAREPVLRGAWVSPGAHINAAGFAGPAGREVDGETVARSRLFADRRESVLNEAGDFVLARQEGMVGDEHIAGELGEVLIGAATGRKSPDEITLFESLGLAVEDLASAHHVYGTALDTGAGTRVALGGMHHAET